jgi:redox-sensitive bicupin YhaK (pirin superfamily)
MIRTIKKIEQSMIINEGGLQMKQPLPSTAIKDIDPFVLLHHHGPMQCEKGFELPFGPHPHRGFETVTIIYHGDIEHKDSLGTSSIIRTGGIQWMTAGSGIIHSENVSEAFKENGGELEIIQLWINLPSSLKMTPPVYQGIQSEQLPLISLNPHAIMKLISGTYHSVQSPVISITDIFLSTISILENTHIQLQVPESSSILFYVKKGNVQIQNEHIKQHSLIQFNDKGYTIIIDASEGTEILFGYGIPYHEPIVARGPFVMNSFNEINQAIDDYHAGNMGNIDLSL